MSPSTAEQDHHSHYQLRSHENHDRPRKRITRACDKCSASRTRCDGKSPCRRCNEYGYACAYTRQAKKRGRPPATTGPRECVTTSTRHGDRSFHSLAYHSREEVSQSSAQNPSENGSHDGHSQPDEHDGSISIWASNGFDYGMNHHISVDQSLPCGPEFLPPPESAQDGCDVSESDDDDDLPAAQDTEGPATTIVSQDSPLSLRNASITNGSLRSDPNTHKPLWFSSRRRESRNECRYPFLNPVLPYIRDIISVPVACELLDIFLTDPGSSLFHGASPFILTRIFRKKSILHPTNPRPTTPALIASILWCVAQTADVMLLQVPGMRSKVVNQLYDLTTSLVSQRDPDRWRRVPGGVRVDKDASGLPFESPMVFPSTEATTGTVGTLDDALTFLFLTIAVSGLDFKSDCQKWWSKSTRLVLSMKLNREDERCLETEQPCSSPLCSCQRQQLEPTHASLEQREERRRVFWLCYSLDRHLALSYNMTVLIPDSYCEVFAPLPEVVWENLDDIPLEELQVRTLTPPTTASGTTFFEYFLPLMVILGDIIEIHHRRRHPRLGGGDGDRSVLLIRELLERYELSLVALEDDGVFGVESAGLPHDTASTANSDVRNHTQLQLVRNYGMHILHVLYVLLYGKWDAICMMDDDDGWITSEGFAECASHAISSSQTIAKILEIDPELTFMSYLFGIYLLHGSFIFLLFADRMPQLGPNQSVELACENIIRAHEVAVVTLNTEFQKTFRKVLRSTLYSVRGWDKANMEAHRSRRRILSLYRWNMGGRGLNL